MKRIALATAAKLPTLNDDDRLLIPALAELGFTAVPAVWDAPNVCWDECHAVLVRSCWDYHHRLEEFLAWVTRLERAGVPLWNPPAVLRWNSHKGYLRELAARGVPIVPTRWLARGRRVGLAQLLRDERWSDAVVKPAVSASATDTWRTSAATAGADQGRLEQLLRAGDVMVQPFIDEVCDPGEWSVVFFGSRFSHAVRKRPAAADYRVQWEFGGGRAPGATAQADRGCRGGHGGGAGPSAVRSGRRGGAGRSPHAHGARADRATFISRLGRGRQRAAGERARGLRQSTLSR